MITFITHLRVKPGNAVAMDAILSEMCAKVCAHEPGVAYYAFARDAKDPDIYAVIEVYRDEAAFFAHGQTDYIKALLPQSAALVEQGKLDIRQYVSPGTPPVQAVLAEDGVRRRGDAP
jgi:quinol monooxygenase YgiN